MGRVPHFVAAKFAEPTSDRFRLWTATSLLEVAEPMSPARALCLACGVGREAVVLAARGWRVTAIDILPDAIERGRRLERAYLPAGSPAINWLCADLRRPLPDHIGVFELVTQLCYSDSRTGDQVSRHLAAGGVALLEAFSDRHWRTAGRAKPGRVLAPQDWTSVGEVDCAEGWHEGRHTTRIVVRKADDLHVSTD